ncbi:MAG: leucine-rich repeat domain-containing protein [Clostridium sp.]|nr:leucine-rich repeat domain-containing protein [Clostridium sp.]
MKKNKILALILSVLIPLTSITIPVYASDSNSNEKIVEEKAKKSSTEPQENLRNGYTIEEAFKFDENTGTITDYSPFIGGTNVKIPPTINGVKVTAIDYGAFKDTQLTNVDIPNSVTSIGNSAFRNNQLTSVYIPDSVTSIGDWAFQSNQLTNIDIPDSVTHIGDYSFSDNQLTSVDIPDSVTSIAESAFQSNQLTSVYIPDSVEIIGDSAFAFNQLTSVDIPDSVTFIAKAAFQSNQLTSVNLGNSVAHIDDFAFNDNQLTSVDIPNSVYYIGNFTFNGNQLTSVDIPDSVEIIGSSAFNDNQLTSLNIPDSVTSIKRQIINYSRKVNIGYEKKDDKYIVNLKKIDSKLDPKKVSNITGGTYDSNTGIITLNEKPMNGTKITYNYEVSNQYCSSKDNTITLVLGEEIDNQEPEIEDKAISDGAYYNSDELFLEGNIETKKIFDANVTKSIVIKSQNGQVKLEKAIENTDKYGNGYSGFKAILSKDDFTKIGDIENGTIEIKIDNNSEITTLPYTVNSTNINTKTTRGYSDWISKQYPIDELPVIEFGKNIVSIKVSEDKKVLINNKLKDYGINLLSYYLNDDRYVLDLGVECGNFNMSTEKHENTFEIKDSNGNIVYTGTVATFADGAYNLPSKTALQIIVPAKYSTDEYNIELIVKDENGVEQYRFTNFPKWN